MAKKAPDVTFIHGFPGAVKSGIARDLKGAPGIVLKIVYGIIGPFVYVPNQECGERHLFLATSAKYPPASAGETAASMVPLGDGLSVARGIDGKAGSGVYSIEQNLESAGPKVEALLAGFRKEGLVEEVWQRTTEEFRRITGVEEVQSTGKAMEMVCVKFCHRLNFVTIPSYNNILSRKDARNVREIRVIGINFTNQAESYKDIAKPRFRK